VGRSSPRGVSRLNAVGLAISTLYLAWSFGVTQGNEKKTKRQTKTITATIRRLDTVRAFPRNRIPSIPLLPVEDVRTGYLEQADVTALLPRIPNSDIRD